jgi:sarcosine oxidase delta subunit
MTNLKCVLCGKVQEAHHSFTTSADMERIGAEDVRRKNWRARLFDEHRRTGHLQPDKTPMYVSGCPACKIARAVNTVEPEDLDSVPRALR